MDLTTPQPHTAYPPRTAFATEQPCTLVGYHAPVPVMTEYHHSKPIFLQNRVYGRIVFGPDLWVCSNCHDAIHAWLYWLLGMHRQPLRVGNNAKAEASRTYTWYRSVSTSSTPVAAAVSARRATPPPASRQPQPSPSRPSTTPPTGPGQ